MALVVQEGGQCAISLLQFIYPYIIDSTLVKTYKSIPIQFPMIIVCGKSGSEVLRCY
jgi:hypothetical protein